MVRSVKAAVIGGGAAGMAAAISVCRRLGKGNAVILEKQSKIGRKLLATGNGRCNIGNIHPDAAHYHGDTAIIDAVLNRYNAGKAKRFYTSMGLLLREDSEGRLYPYSNRAETVLDCLRMELHTQSVDIYCNAFVQDIHKDNNGFLLRTNEQTIHAEYLIFAAGSQAAPSLGADDSGYRLLESLGIHPTPLFPSLCPIPCQERYPVLKGVRAKCQAALYGDNRLINTQQGEVQFTDNGLSGICIFNLSRYVNAVMSGRRIDGSSCRCLTISLDLMPEYHEEDMVRYLRQCRKLFGNEDVRLLLSAALDKKLAAALADYSGIRHTRCGNLTEQQLQHLAKCIKQFNFTPKQSTSYQNAQVSGGGFDCKTVDPQTLMCRKVKNLFVCGELLDADGECGGYNLHFAFGSGILAADSVK